ncbi:MAG: ATP-binding protein [Candidatus Thermoplasmatota archaeon]|nr:ATP-binding protein [Candidatus Thermoplasmatota archaeon]
MKRFVDRDEELETLRKLYRSDKFEFTSIIGRRRVGKTELIKKFLEDKNGIYLYVSLSDDKQLRLHTAKRLNEVLGVSLVGEPTWRDIIDALFDKSEDERLVVVFDEFQRMLKINESVPSLLQEAIDNRKSTSKMLLCVAGSSIGMIERLFQSDASLYGRRTRNIRLNPFDYEGVRKWFDCEEIDERSILKRYAVFGGTPKYLEFVTGASFIENIDEQILSPNSLLYDEPWVLLSTELKSPDKYFDILKLISLGKETPKEISDQLDLERTSLGYYLKKLRKDLDMIKRLAPATEKVTKSKKKRYRIKDNFFKFWFHYVYPHKDQLEIGDREGVKGKIEHEFGGYMGKIFEDVAREIIKKRNGKRLLDWKLERYEKIGSWWDRQGNEIDICGISKGRDLLGEVKWSLLDESEVKALHEKMRTSKIGDGSRFLIVSREFTPKAREYLQGRDVIHISTGDFAEIF